MEQAPTEGRRAPEDGFKPVKELRESLLLIVLMISSMVMTLVAEGACAPMTVEQ